MNILEIEDKTGRLIRLTKERWSHIRRDHPDVQEQEIETTLACPIRIIPEKLDKHFYYCYFKNKSSSAKYLRVIVKYLNGNGFVITAYFVRNID